MRKVDHDKQPKTSALVIFPRLRPRPIPANTRRRQQGYAVRWNPILLQRSKVNHRPSFAR